MSEELELRLVESKKSMIHGNFIYFWDKDNNVQAFPAFHVYATQRRIHTLSENMVISRNRSMETLEYVVEGPRLFETFMHLETLGRRLRLEMRNKRNGLEVFGCSPNSYVIMDVPERKRNLSDQVLDLEDELCIYRRLNAKERRYIENVKRYNPLFLV